MIMRQLHAGGHLDREYRTQPPAPRDATAHGKSATGAATGATTVAAYLNQRLHEVGVRHVFAIPGDYIAEWVNTLDDPTTSCGLQRVHPNNEVTATYAADGYGRVGTRFAGSETGPVGCVAFTYGVGAINAAQAVAGAFVERSPLVVINGSPSTAQFNSERDQGVKYHHMVDGSHTDIRIFANITALAVRIDNPASAPELIDAALQTCLSTSRPVYIEIANTVALQPCRPVPSTRLDGAPVLSTAKSVNEAVAAVMAHLAKAKRAVIVGGSEIARRKIQDRFAELLRRIDAPYVTSPLGKSVLSEFRDDVRYCGVYFGLSSPPDVHELMTSADCIIALGVQDTDFNYLGVVTPGYDPATASDLPGPTHIQARDGAVLVGRGLAYWGDVELEDFVNGLLDALDSAPTLPGAPFPGIEEPVTRIAEVDAAQMADHITYDSFKALLHHQYLVRHQGDNYPQIVADSGFSFLSNIDLPSAEGGFIAQLAWAAIGYGVGATAGVTLANRAVGRQRRTITITGDGAFAETVNAIGTVAQLGQDAVIFVMDNRVFAVEQWLIDANAFCSTDPPPFEPLTDVPQGHIWDYVKLAEGFGGRGHLVETNEELRAVLEALDDIPINPVTGQPTFTLVAVRLPATSVPENARWKMNCKGN